MPPWLVALWGCPVGGRDGGSAEAPGAATAVEIESRMNDRLEPKSPLIPARPAASRAGTTPDIWASPDGLGLLPLIEAQKCNYCVREVNQKSIRGKL